MPKKTKAEKAAAKKVRRMRRGLAKSAVKECSITGSLSSREDSRDVQITAFSISLYGRDIVKDTELRISHGRRYGLIGQNGSGKSTLLFAIASRELPIPEHIDIWHLNAESTPEKRSALEVVMDSTKKESEKLEDQMEKLLEEDPESYLVEILCERLDCLEINTLESRAASLLFGLGFTEEMMYRNTEDMSGGWRMRVSLAQALLASPSLLLLDEPTNHLDLEACIWLEVYLASYPHTLIVVSHSQDFLNGVCTNIMEINHDQRLEYYGGNYDTFVRTREEVRTNQTKKYKKERDDISKLQHFIRSCGTYSNLVKQAQSKQKIIDKMKEGGLTPIPKSDPKYSFRFPNCGDITPPVLSFKMVSFSYSGLAKDYLYTKLDFGVDLDSRIALVGPNGVGKSTLLKLMIGELQPTEGDISRHTHLRFAYYNQHSEEQLDLSKTPIQFLQDKFKDGVVTKTSGGRRIRPEVDQWRQILGSYGVTGYRQTSPMGTMSDGLKTRVVFAILGLQNPHILLLDEPTNHLDMGCINSLAEAIRRFEGGLVLVSHDFRLLSQVAEDIWVCNSKSVSKWAGDIRTYKEELKKIGIKNIEKKKKSFAG